MKDFGPRPDIASNLAFIDEGVPGGGPSYLNGTGKFFPHKRLQVNISQRFASLK